MKKIKLLVFGIMLMLAASAQSQLSVTVNIGTPPAWGPAGYNDVRYYYLPDIETYYDVQSSMFIYISDHRWVRRSYLPPRYRNYDLYRSYKVVMNDYHGNSPYSNFKEHRMKYARGYRGSAQRNIGERNNRQEKHTKFQPNKRNEKANDHIQMRNNNQKQGNDRGNERGNDKKQERDNDKKDSHNNGKRNSK